MLRPKLTVLTPDLIAKILSEAFALLEKPGVRIQNQETLSLLAEAGAGVDLEKQMACIPERVIRRALESAPSEFRLYALDGQAAVRYGGEAVAFDPGSTAVSILSDEKGNRRTPDTADLVRFVKLVETLPQIDAQSTAFVCQDVPEGIGDLYRLYLALNLMRKPIITGAFSIEGCRTMCEMLVAVAGGDKALAERPVAVFDVCPSPPLLWSNLSAQNLLDLARWGIPIELVSMPLAGVTCPVTLTAAVVQHTAESLSGLVIAQLARPGAAVVWGGAPAATDMRTGATPMGDVSTWLIDCAFVEVGKSLGLPTHTYMGSSDAKLLDAQAGLESAGGTFLAALAGVNMISGAGMLDFLRCQSFEKLVIDAEIIGMAKHLLAGIEARDDPMALEMMRQSAQQADFLSHPHTLRWFAQELYIPSAIIDRSALDIWQGKGSTSIFQRAACRVEELLKTYQPNPLSEGTRKELRKIATSAARKHGMVTLPIL